MAFAALGRPASPAGALLFALVTLVSGIVNLTPGNLGVAEAAAWITARALGVDPGEAVVAYTLFRIASIVVILVLTPVFLPRLSPSLSPSRKPPPGGDGPALHEEQP
jgi:uncharacterized membrane protein YbhN (UPF0104 family)